MASVWDRLKSEGVPARVIIPAPIEALLSGLLIQTSGSVPNGEAGDLTFGVQQQALGAFDLDLTPPGPDARRYVLTFEGPPNARTAFRLGVQLTKQGESGTPVFRMLATLPGHALVPAVLKTAAGKEWLEPDPVNAGPVRLAGLDPALVIKGREGQEAVKTVAATVEGPDGIVRLTLAPATVLLGQTGLGLQVGEGVIVDDSTDDAVVLPGQPAEAPAWRGLLIPGARLFLPESVPFIGGHAVAARLTIGRAPTPGIDLVLEATVPADGDRPEIRVRIECHDPTAFGLSSFVPTLVEASMVLPLDRQESFTGGTVAFISGKPVVARARWARPPQPPAEPVRMEFALAIESQGPDGILTVRTAGGGVGERAVVTAGALATALIARSENKPPAGDATGDWLNLLLTAAVGLSSFLHPEGGRLTLHGAELLATGGVLPKVFQLRLDYSVAAVVDTFSVGVMSIGMRPAQPMRVRAREVLLTLAPDQPGLQKIRLDYTRASLELEDPGGWQVQGPGSLFDVLGTRSGRGSMWIEVDLRFKLDLGPVKVSGATIRATLDEDGALHAELRGLEASLSLPPLIDGEGAVHLRPAGFDAFLAARIQPLNGLAARADLEVAADMLKLALGVDLPGPIPLANTGLGLYGLGGVFAINGRPSRPGPGEDPIAHALAWNYTAPGAFVPADAFSFGFIGVIGTAPDMGFTFSARAGIFVTTPDIAIRGAVNGKFLGPRVSIALDNPGPALLQARGVIIIDPADGVTIALQGEYVIPDILEIIVPVGARFPVSGRDWYIHLGADGWRPPAGKPSEGREMGPVRATVLPGILDQHADAYLMFRGNGITDWPRGGQDAIQTISVAPGMFVLAFGFGFQFRMGIKPVVWADVNARADILVVTDPKMLVGLGKVGGSLHIGPFSTGVEASVHVHIVDGEKPYLKAEVCGKIDLVFDTLRECVTILYNAPPAVAVPPPKTTPLDRPQGQALVDDKYRVIGRLATDRASGARLDHAVWPDAIPHLTFSTAPTLTLGSSQFKDPVTGASISQYPEGLRARPLGNDLLLYEWELTKLELVDDTNPSAPTLVPGPLSWAWLAGKFGDAGGQPEPAELALLTPRGDLWFDALGDAGASLPHDPLGTAADICQARSEARLGWAPGGGATPSGSGFVLPPDPVSADPVQSQVRAQTALEWRAAASAPWEAVDEISAQRFPLPYAYEPSAVVAFAAQRLDGRMFSNALEVGGAVGPPVPDGDVNAARRPFVLQLRIALDDALSEARLWLSIRADMWLFGDVSSVAVADDLGRAWQVSGPQADLGDGLVALRFAPPPLPVGDVKQILVRILPGDRRVGVIGVGGVTAKAPAAAAQRSKAAALQAALLTLSAVKGPVTPMDGSVPFDRNVLKPDRIYRINVSMRWVGTLYGYDDTGLKKPIAGPADGTQDFSYWFRTARLDQTFSAAVLRQNYGTSEVFSFLRKKQDLFNPAMLERHLRGYVPAQSALDRFADDPVQVVFGVSHAAVLAHAYGFTLKCGLRRTDVPEVDADDMVLDGVWLWAKTPDFMTKAEAVRFDAYLGSPCAHPTPTSTLEVPVPPLARQAWYEVFALAESQSNDVADGRLPGVTFRTSRWGGPAEMMSAIAAAIAGGIAIRADAVLPAGAGEASDTAFDAMLESLGIDGWPEALSPRVSLLWRPTPGGEAAWTFVGALIESPEPIHRPGRFELQAATVLVSFLGITVERTLDVTRRDRSGSRLIVASSQPVEVFSVLKLTGRDLRTGAPVVAELALPRLPSFALEAA